MRLFDIELKTETLQEQMQLICRELKPNWSDQLDKLFSHLWSQH